MTQEWKRWCLLAGAAIALGGAAIHWIAPVFGAPYYAALGAPPWLVASARAHGWQAPVMTVAIGTLMGICAAYGASGAGLVRRLPLLRTALVVIALVGLVRGLLVLPYLLLVPGTFTPFNVLGSLVWFVAGTGFAIGAAMQKSR